VIDWSCRLLVGTFCETLRAFAPFLGEISLFFSSFPPFSKTRAPMHKTWARRGRCCLCGVSCLRVTVLSLRGFCVGVTRRQQRLWAHVTSRNRPGLLWLTLNAYACRIFLWSSRFSSCLKPKRSGATMTVPLAAGIRRALNHSTEKEYWYISICLYPSWINVNFPSESWESDEIGARTSLAESRLGLPFWPIRFLEIVCFHLRNHILT
jgi:hypothetical protein